MYDCMKSLAFCRNVLFFFFFFTNMCDEDLPTLVSMAARNSAGKCICRPGCPQPACCVVRGADNIESNPTADTRMSAAPLPRNPASQVDVGGADGPRSEQDMCSSPPVSLVNRLFGRTMWTDPILTSPFVARESAVEPS